MAVPNIFATATTSIPLSQLDANFAYFANAITVNYSSTALTIDSSGNLGVGTASPSSYGKSAILTSANSGNGGSATTITNSSLALGGTATSGALAMGVDSSGTFYSWIQSTTTANVPYNLSLQPAGGNLGIGTVAPNQIVDVLASNSGYQRISFRNSGAECGWGVTGTGYSYNGVGAFEAWLYANATAINIGSDGAYPVKFTINGSERARFTSAGQFLIATTSTGYPVNINGNGNDTVNIFSSSFPSGNYFIRFGVGAGNGTSVGNISYNGTGVSYNTASDYRLKENIEPMKNALSKVALLNPVTYTWKADGADGQGFIAHELQTVFPDAVTGKKDDVDAEGNPRYQGVDTSFLVATLTKAIQELKSELDAVKAEIATLKGA